MINNNGLKLLDLFKIRYFRKIKNWVFKSLILNSLFKYIKLLFKWYNKLFKMINRNKQDKALIKKFRKFIKTLFLIKVYSIQLKSKDNNKKRKKC